ncbi:hypothetical protein E2C01_001335 [Portunus trituberculatus]|uniref:Uncharacterized protein n=1 Tax=Portunus trituberculatus TaxID=210409 RepID=A0A5B7CJ09_PORTR|nr:hypothetical protein [Portunus trituberculatus]
MPGILRGVTPASPPRGFLPWLTSRHGPPRTLGLPHQPFHRNSRSFLFPITEYRILFSYRWKQANFSCGPVARCVKNMDIFRIVSWNSEADGARSSTSILHTSEPEPCRSLPDITRFINTA